MKRSITIVVTLVALAGCASSHPSNAASPSSTSAAPTSSPPTSTAAAVAADPCKLVSLSDAQTLAGTPLAAGQEGNPANPSCTYTGPPSGPEAQVQVFVGDGAKKTLDIDRTLGHSFTALAGVADEAYQENNAVFLRNGTTWVAIELVLLDDPAQNRLPLQHLAAKVAAALTQVAGS